MKKKSSKKTGRAPQIKGKNFRLVIPDLTQFKNSTLDQLMTLKGDVLNFLKQKQKTRDLQYYSIAVERHPTTGIPHLDILLVYPKSVLTSLNRFDKFIKHGDLTRYKTLNLAIIEYNFKEDKQLLSNLPKDLNQIINIQQIKKNSYSYLYDKMKQDPLHFNLQQYI